MSIFPSNDETYNAVYAEEAAMIDASELLADALERSGLSRADLARQLGVSRSEITARLGGERNITVRKLAATLHALGTQLQLKSDHESRAEVGKDAVVLAFASRYSLAENHTHTARPCKTGPRKIAAGTRDYLKAMGQ